MSSRMERESFKTPTKSREAKKSTKTVDYSSDSSYGGVYDISDDEDDDSDDDPDVFRGAGGPVEKYEEEALFESAEEDDDICTVEDDDTDSQETPLGKGGDITEYADADDEEWAGIPESPEELLGDASFFEDNYVSTTEAYGSSKKKVTFDLSDSSSIASEDSYWPDLFDNMDNSANPFMSADALPDRIARRLENDDDNDDQDISDHDVYWGNGSSDHEAQDSDEDGDSESVSGYQSDDGGDTTDDEDWAENRPDGIESINRRNSLPPPPSCGLRIRRVKGKPDEVTWYHNTNVPFVILDEAGKELLMFDSVVTPQIATETPSPIKNGVMTDLTPVLSNQANVMMSAMQDSPLDFQFGFGQPLARPEAFFSGFNFDANNSPADDSSYDESDNSKNEPFSWNDMLHLDNALDDDEDVDDDALEPAFSTPTRATPVRSEDQVHPLLEHLDRNPVGAFRHNQQSQRLINSNTISQEALAFGTDTIKGVKNGHLNSLTSSLTPRRKPKSMIPSSPAAALADRKRKSSDATSNEHQSHKRSRRNASTFSAKYP